MSRPIYGITTKLQENCPAPSKGSTDVIDYLKRADNILKQLLEPATRNKDVAVERLDMLMNEIRLTHPKTG